MHSWLVSIVPRPVIVAHHLQALYKEAVVWTQLDHDHILPFLGICDNLFGLSDSTVLVSPWVELGDLAEFSKASQQLEYDGTGFVSGIDLRMKKKSSLIIYSQILQIASGLEYLHSQEPHVVHGDLRGVRHNLQHRDSLSHVVLRATF